MSEIERTGEENIERAALILLSCVKLNENWHVDDLAAIGNFVNGLNICSSIKEELKQAIMTRRIENGRK